MHLSLAIFIPFIAAVFVPFLYKWFTKIHIGWFVLTIPVALFVFLSSYIPRIAKGKSFTEVQTWIPSYDIHITTHFDGLSMIFGLLITGVGSLVILYSIFYLSTKQALHHFYVYLLMFMGAMLGVVFSDHLMVLYAFWELTSVASFLLIAFWHHRKASRAGARKAMVITVSGGIAMLAGFLMLHEATGTFSVTYMVNHVEEIQQHHLFIPALLLVLLGAFTKSAQFPFHIWLPDAMEAPTPVSAYLHSATMVKAGIYLVARMTPIFGGADLWFWTVSSIGLLTLFWGSFHAVRQYDLKALLAYSTISQLGLIMCLIGLGSIGLAEGYSETSILYTQATFAALFHLINHSTFKGALFMMVGIVDHEVGTRDIRRLGGLMAIMPFTFTIAVIGSFSMAGLPPFNGFLSKEMFFTAVVEISQLQAVTLSSLTVLFPIVAWIASIFTFIYCMIIIGKTFFGSLKLERLEKKPHEAPIGMLISPFILIILVVAIFFSPNTIGKYLIAPAMLSIFPTYPLEEMIVKIKPWHGFNLELWMTITVFILGFIMYRSLAKWRKWYSILLPQFTFNELYENVISKSEQGAQTITSKYMTSNLSHYFSYIYIAFVAILLSYFIYTDSWTWSGENDSPIVMYEMIFIIIMMCSTIAMLFVRRRVAAVLLTGVIGYGVAFLFVIFSAPDLALTQLVVESVTTALFLICFRFLPELPKERSTKKERFSKGLLSVLVGATVTLIALAVLHYEKFTRISIYFENSYELAGGKNIVNAILGDFRAFDTMLEVVVLFIAGLAIFTLVKFKSKKDGVDIEN